MIVALEARTDAVVKWLQISQLTKQGGDVAFADLIDETPPLWGSCMSD
jgi:hypothetical protein